MMLSPHFALSELVASQEAIRRRIDNAPGPEHIENLRRLCETLEQVRTVLGKPITINSGSGGTEPTCQTSARSPIVSTSSGSRQ